MRAKGGLLSSMATRPGDHVAALKVHRRAAPIDALPRNKRSHQTVASMIKKCDCRDKSQEMRGKARRGPKMGRASVAWTSKCSPPLGSALRQRRLSAILDGPPKDRRRNACVVGFAHSSVGATRAVSSPLLATTGPRAQPRNLLNCIGSHGLRAARPVSLQGSEA